LRGVAIVALDECQLIMNGWTVVIWRDVGLTLAPLEVRSAAMSLETVSIHCAFMRIVVCRTFVHIDGWGNLSNVVLSGRSDRHVWRASQRGMK